jgi:hypothetical protein
MNKVLVDFVSVYRGPAVKLHRAEASRLTEEVNVKHGIYFELDSNVQ